MDYGDETNLLGVDEDIFHVYEKPGSPHLESDSASPVPDSPDCDGFSFDWDGNVQKKGAPGDNLHENNTECSASGAVRRVRSILKRPSVYFSGDFSADQVTNANSDFLDLQRSSSQLHKNATPRGPRKLRKKRSSVAASSFVQSPSALSKRKSVASMISRISFRRPDDDEGLPPLPVLKFLDASDMSVSSAALNLPKGIVQSGKGIGFHYAPPASRSRLSLSSATKRSCFSGLKMLCKGPCRSSGEAGKSRHDVMNHIYGSTWSMHTNEAQMSTVTFTLPEGLGRRVDSLDIQPQES